MHADLTDVAVYHDLSNRTSRRTDETITYTLVGVWVVVMVVLQSMQLFTRKFLRIFLHRRT